MAHRLDFNLQAYRDSPSGFSIIEQTEWSNGWQENVPGLAKILPAKVDAVTEAAGRVMETLQIQRKIERDSEANLLAQLARAILKTHRKDFAFISSANLNDRLEAAETFVRCLKEFSETGESLSVRDADDAARRINPDEIAAQWTVTSSKFWLLNKLMQPKSKRCSNAISPRRFGFH